ncbi:hypothetical protein SELMODRAFT_97863 [Selaginella moellendorffii]|uniref:Major facilitator superfamily (MFS) profile domain-containing protein n=1 Tax=Selaginella moellendorffii TaxID=88036 RepID=D8RN97_SELML|nr:hypothetical protein SELMODRAFT_97863 [Selaginella moellendorffii]
MEEPLLGRDRQQPELEFPDCPGCQIWRLREKGSPPPLKQLVSLGFVVLCNALPISVLYPFLYFMVRDFHVAKTESDIGFYAGWIGSSFMAGRFFTAVFWGYLADRIGRRPVMVLGIVSVLVFNTLFGVSTSFTMALVTRFCLGSFNGMLGPVKAYASEICSDEHQALGVSVVGTTWGLGLIVGPALGGFLSQPAVKYPNVFHHGSLFARFPYLLQALVVSAIALLGLCMCFTLPETLHKHPKRNISAAEDKQPARKQSILKNWPFLASTTVYCLWSLHDIAYTEIFSLWAVSPRLQGGLSFTSSDVGEVLAISGESLCFAMLVFQLTIFPAVANMLGPIFMTRISAILAIPILCIYPLMSKLENVWLWVVLLTASVLKFVLTTATMTGSFLLINNSVTQEQRGAANGLSLSVVSLFKALGPAGGGSVFAWAQKRQHAAFLPGEKQVCKFVRRA